MKPIGACIFVVSFLMIVASLVRFDVFVMPPGGSKMLVIDVSIGRYQWLGWSPSHHEVLTPVQLLLRLQNHHHHTQAAMTTTPQTSLAMDQEEKKQGQSIRDQLKGHSLPDGGEIVGSINSSSSEFNATNNRAHIVRQYESGYTASERKSTRETPDRKGIPFAVSVYKLLAIYLLCSILLEDLRQYFICKLSVFLVYFCISSAFGLFFLLGLIVPLPPETPYLYPYQYPYPYPENLRQYFGHKRADVAARLGVSVSTFKRMCRLQGITRWRNRMGSSGSVSKPPDQHGERSTSTACETPSHNVQTGMEGELVGQNEVANVFRRDFTGGPIALNTSTTRETPSHNVQTGMEGEPVGQNQEANECRRDFMERQIALNAESGLITVLRPPDQHGERNASTARETPSHNVHTGIEGVPVGQNQEANEFRRDFTEFRRDFTEGSIPSNTANGLIIGGSSEWASQVNVQSTLSTPYQNHNALVFPQPQITSMPSENRGGSIDWRNSLASQAEPFSDRHISGSSNLAFPTWSDQAAPSQHAEVFRPRDQHGERNTSTLWETPSHNVQPGMDGEPVGQNQEANVFRRDFMEGPIAMNTEGGLIMVLRPPDQYEERNTSTACEAPPHNVQTGIEGESVGHSPACFTVQTLSPRPSARRTPAPTAEPSIPLEDRQQEENEASFVDTTSITYSNLSRLCEGENIVQTDDILGGQGSAALWDYTIGFGMGEQNREVETREQPSPQRSPAADRGKGPANNEMEMPIRLFPLANLVEEVCHPLLNTIARAHPETFAHFNPRTPLLGSMLLRNLHDLLVPWARLRFDEFTLAKETAMQELSQDLVSLGFDLGWLSARGSALRAAKERVALQPEIQSLSTLVESTRESLANLEARLAQAKRQDAELAAAALNLADLGPSELVFEELAS